MIYGLSKDLSQVLFTESAPYKLFQRGPEKWVRREIQEAHEVPKTFWVALDFKAHHTKGVYVSYDTSSGGKHSKVGLPGGEEPQGVDFGGDWMIRAEMAEESSPFVAGARRAKRSWRLCGVPCCVALPWAKRRGRRGWREGRRFTIQPACPRPPTQITGRT